MRPNVGIVCKDPIDFDGYITDTSTGRHQARKGGIFYQGLS